MLLDDCNNNELLRSKSFCWLWCQFIILQFRATFSKKISIHRTHTETTSSLCFEFLFFQLTEPCDTVRRKCTSGLRNLIRSVCIVFWEHCHFSNNSLAFVPLLSPGSSAKKNWRKSCVVRKISIHETKELG